MAIKLAVTDLGEIPEQQRSLYRERQDGAGYILDVEGGAVPKAVHDQFRTTNIELLKKLKAAGDFDPEELATLRATNAQLRAEMERSHKGATAEAEARVKAIEAKANGYRTQLEGLLIDSEVSRVANALGAVPGAIDDIASRVRSRFRLGDDGKPVAVDAQGNTIWGEDGQALSVNGAVRQLTRQAPHLFAKSSGSGAAHVSASGGHITHGLGNPFRKGESFNLTEQSRIMKTNPAEAERLAAEAGVSL